MNDKLKRLELYASVIKGKLSDSLPSKHKNRPAQYKEYLNSELSKTNAAIGAIRDAAIGGAK